MKRGEGLWVLSDWHPDRGYTTSVTLDEDLAFTLTPDEAVAYGQYVLRQLHAAEYDAAVLRQMTEKVGMDVRGVTGLIKDLRAERPPAETPHPVTFEPVVSSLTGKPLLHLLVDGRKRGQLDPPAARGLVMDLLETHVAADLDGVYAKVLRAAGVEPERAAAVVDDLRHWRAPHPRTESA